MPASVRGVGGAIVRALGRAEPTVARGHSAGSTSLMEEHPICSLEFGERAERTHPPRAYTLFRVDLQ